MLGGNLNLNLCFAVRRLNHGPDAVPRNCLRGAESGPARRRSASDPRARRAAFSIDSIFCVARRARGKWRRVASARRIALRVYVAADSRGFPPTRAAPRAKRQRSGPRAS